MQQMKLMAVDLAVVRRSVGQLAANQDQLAAKQDQMSQNISMLQQVEQDVRQQVLSPPAAKPVHPTPAPHVPLQASPATGASTPERR
jgi:transcription elongation GreA/GreB family factor